MTAAPPGAVVGLYYDSRREVAVGDFLRTRAGRLYELVTVRRQVRGAHVGRWHLRALVRTELPPGATVHPLLWYPRRRHGRGGLRA